MMVIGYHGTDSADNILVWGKLKAPAWNIHFDEDPIVFERLVSSYLRQAQGFAEKVRAHPRFKEVVAIGQYEHPDNDEETADIGMYDLGMSMDPSFGKYREDRRIYHVFFSADFGMACKYALNKREGHYKGVFEMEIPPELIRVRSPHSPVSNNILVRGTINLSHTRALYVPKSILRYVRGKAKIAGVQNVLCLEEKVKSLE